MTFCKLQKHIAKFRILGLEAWKLSEHKRVWYKVKRSLQLTIPNTTVKEAKNEVRTYKARKHDHNQYNKHFYPMNDYANK